MGVWRKKSPSRGIRPYKVPEVGVCLVRSVNIKGTSVAEVELVMQGGVGKSQGGLRPQ